MVRVGGGETQAFREEPTTRQSRKSSNAYYRECWEGYGAEAEKITRPNNLTRSLRLEQLQMRLVVDVKSLARSGKPGVE